MNPPLPIHLARLDQWRASGGTAEIIAWPGGYEVELTPDTEGTRGRNLPVFAGHGETLMEAIMRALFAAAPEDDECR